MMSAIKKVLDLRGYDIVELTTQEETLKNYFGVYDERWLVESKSKLLCELKQLDGEKRANIITARTKKQVIKR